MKAVLKTLYQNLRNKKIKELIFKAFSKDWEVRSEAGFNPNTPVSVLEYLSNDEEQYVRYSVAQNPSTPVSILEKLSNDENDYVRLYAIENYIFRNKKQKKFYETYY